jgi:hypothetical protein
MTRLPIRLLLAIGVLLLGGTGSVIAQEPQANATATHTDWGVVIATLAGALIGAAALWIVEYLRSERRAIRFIINASEDLARALRPYGSLQVKIGDNVTQELTAASVTIKNVGNMTVAPFNFSLTIPGSRQLAFVRPTTDNEVLRSAIEGSCGDKPLKNDPTFNIKVPYVNRRESFKVATLFDGQPQRLTVACRLPNVVTQTSLEEQQQLPTTWPTSLTWGLALASIVLALLSAFSSFRTTSELDARRTELAIQQVQIELNNKFNKLETDHR